MKPEKFEKTQVPLGWPNGYKYTLFFYKNIFYKNIEAEICEILRIL